MTLSYDLQLDLGTNFNTACCFLSFHRQLKTRLLFPHTNTLYQPVKTGKKAGEMTQRIKTFFHTHQGVFMWTKSGRGIHDHHSLFRE